MKKLTSFFKKHKVEVGIVSIILLISALAHGYNMFHFPYYENDEGVYMSQAWSLFKKGELAPYTYWYDHAPAGWFFIAIWTFLTGGFFTFGFSINSGRVLMLITHVISSLLLYLIVRRLTKSKLAGVTSVMIFALSPLGIYFQRRVLLDNIMVFWLMLSLTFLLYYKNRLRNVILSAITFAIGMLSKETAIFLTPVFFYVLFKESHKKHRSFALIIWLFVIGLISSMYVMYAFLKGELFPYGTFLGGSHPHVSLIDALRFQAGRGGGSVFDMEKSSFWTNMRVWLGEDPAIIYLGVIATIGNLFFAIKNYAARVAGLLSAAFWYFLMRGGLVIEFYVIPLIPILAINIAVFGWLISRGVAKVIKYRNLKNLRYIPMTAILLCYSVAAISLSTNVRNVLNIYTSDQTTPQIAAVEWILSRNIPNAFYVIDNYGYIDLQERKNDDSIKTEWYWKVDRDPDVKDKLLKNDVRNIDYVGLTPQMKNDIAYSGLGLTLAGWKNSHPVVDFSNDYWGVDYWGNTYPRRILRSTWQSYKRHFIIQGRVIDPYQNNLTTSEGQSYALLRAVWMDDKETFDQVLSWTSKNLQQQDNLFAWKWNMNKEGVGMIEDGGAATDADQDIALALLFAHARWNQNSYKTEAIKILNGIWENEIAMVGNKPYISAGPWANKNDAVIINPSYLSPASYRIFAKVDTAHNWNDLVATSYDVLRKCTVSPLDKEAGVLPPEWCALDKESLSVSASTEEGTTSSEYSYNAFRTSWRVALDAQWNNAPEAKAYLSSLRFLQNEWSTHKKLATAYTHDGKVWEDYESVAAYAGNLPYFSITHPAVADEMYKEKILGKFYEEKEVSYWEDKKNYYTQNWAWFSTALYARELPNLWKDANTPSAITLNSIK